MADYHPMPCICVKSVKRIYGQHETSGEEQSEVICFLNDSALLWAFTITTNLK